jgi:hypothetical protein
MPLSVMVCTSGRGTLMERAAAEVHCHTCEGAGAALRTSLRGCRGVHKSYLPLDVATYEAMVNAKRVTPHLIRRMCVGNLSAHTHYT